MAAIIKPFDERNGHAINNVLIVFEFASPLSPHAFERLRVGGDLHAALKNELPRFVEQQQMMLNFAVGPGQPLPQGFSVPNGMGIGGVSFSRVRPDGEPAISVNIETNALLIICGEYERWAKVAEEVHKYLEILTPWLSGVRISSAVLQYLDKFRVDFEEQRLLPLDSLFNPGSRYIPPNFLNISDAFHSHHGFFSHPDFKLPGKVLVNVNINVNAAAATYDVNIATMHKYNLASDIGFVEQEQINPVLRETLQYLHDESKSVFGDLLTSQARGLISLDSRQEARD